MTITAVIALGVAALIISLCTRSLVLDLIARVESLEARRDSPQAQHARAEEAR